MSYEQRDLPLRLNFCSALLVTALVGCIGTAGCSTTGAIVAGVVGVTVVGGQSPANELDQIYYVGVFDPQDQVPPQIYRLTVRGQASSFSNMKFGSGWVHASLIDSLETRATFDSDTGVPQIQTGRDGGKDDNNKPLPGIKTGRRLMMFGPEGFREAPRHHRLVIVMGASPQKFFQAVDSSLGLISRVQRDAVSPEVARDLFTERERLRSERTVLAALKADVAADLADPPVSSAATAAADEAGSSGATKIAVAVPHTKAVTAIATRESRSPRR